MGRLGGAFHIDVERVSQLLQEPRVIKLTVVGRDNVSGQAVQCQTVRRSLRLWFCLQLHLLHFRLRLRRSLFIKVEVDHDVCRRHCEDDTEASL